MAIKLPPNDFDTETELTVGLDNVKGEGGNDEFIGTFDTGTNAGINTANPGDRVNGKDGEKDTLTLTTSGDGSDYTLPGMVVKNIEILDIRNFADEFDFDASQVSGLETVVFDGHLGGEVDIHNMSDEVDVAFSGGSLDDTHDVALNFVGNAWSGMDDTMQLQFTNSNVEFDVDVDGFFADDTGGVENAVLKSKGGIENIVEFDDFDGLRSLTVTGNTDLDLETGDNMFSVINMKKMKGDVYLMADDYGSSHYHHDDGGSHYSYSGTLLTNNSEGGAAKVTGGKGSDDLSLEGSSYLSGPSKVVDAIVNTKKGSDDVDASNFDMLTLKLGGGSNYADVWDVNTAVIKGGKGMDDIEVDAHYTATVDGKDGDNYIDAYAGGYGLMMADVDDEPVLVITTDSGEDDIEADTGYGGNALITSGGGNDDVDVAGVSGFVDIKTQGNDDDVFVGGRGISEGDMINGGNGMDLLIAGGEDMPSEAAVAVSGYNGFNVINSDNSFAGVSNMEAVFILDDYDYDELATFNGDDTGANDTDNGDDPAGIFHYILGDDYYGISDDYNLDDMKDGVTLDVNVMGSNIDRFELDLEGDDDGAGQVANINIISSLPHGYDYYDGGAAPADYEYGLTNFRNVDIEDTEVLNIGLEHVPYYGGEDLDEEPGIVAFGNPLSDYLFADLGEDGGLFGDEDLEEINVSGDLHFGSGIAAGSLEEFNGGDMTGTAILGFMDVADTGFEATTGEGHDIVLALDEDAEFEINSGDGVDIVAVFHEEAQDDVLSTGDDGDLAFAGYGNDEINTGGGDDIAIFIEEDANDADTFNGGSGFDTAVLISDGSPFPVSIDSESQFMNRWTSVESLVLGGEDDSLLLNAIAADAGIEQVDLSVGGEDELMVGTGFDQDALTVLLSNERFLTHPLVDAHTGPAPTDVDFGMGFDEDLAQFGLNIFSYNTEGVYVDSEVNDLDLTVSGIAATFHDENGLMAGDGVNDELVVIADDMGYGPDPEFIMGGYWDVFKFYFDDTFDGGASIAHFGDYATGFESLTVLHDDENDVGVWMDDANVASGLVFKVDATDLVHEPGLANNTISGHDAGNFYFDGGAETDGTFDIDSGEGDDLLIGSMGNDEINGNDGDDVIVGGLGGNDTLNGDAGDDQIHGGEGVGADTIDGGADDDDIIGALGGDDLTGGTGADTFVYEDVLDSNGAIEDGNVDIINDFSSAEGDMIDLSAFAVDGDTLSFLGSYGSAFQLTNALDGTGGDNVLEVAYLNDGTDTSIYVDLNDDGVINNQDLQIDMDGLASMSAGDFILA